MQSGRSTKTAQAGVTLLELMVVVMLVGILAAIGYPAFREQALRSARAEGRSALLDVAARQEQFFLDNRRYSDALADLGIAATTEHEKYVVSVDGATAGCPLSTCFSLTATAQAGQADDAACGNLTLDSNGTRSATGTAPGDCW